MISDKKYQKLANQVYWVEQNRSDVEYHPIKNKTYYYDRYVPSLGQFQVLKVQDNNSDSDFTNNNGMQAMAVAPVINGKVDTTQIIIAYAGTKLFRRTRYAN